MAQHVSIYSLDPPLLCRILSLVPLSKSKLRLCIVSRAWQDAILSPDSHSAQLPQQVGPQLPLVAYDTQVSLAAATVSDLQAIRSYACRQ